jgi:hypothetical protein
VSHPHWSLLLIESGELMPPVCHCW